MPSESEQAVASFFHTMRSLSKQKPAGEPPDWMMERAERQYLACREAAKTEWLAARDEIERSWE